jgi:hypothetical protein
MRVLAAAVVLLLAIAPSQARSLWPWEQPRPVHRHAPAPPPDCGQINEAVKALDAEHFERAMRSSTAAQRHMIAKCRAPYDDGLK